MPRPTGPQPPPSPEWHESDYLVANDFQLIAERRVEIKITMDRLAKEQEELNLEIGAMLATSGHNAVRYGQHRFTLGHSTKGGKLSKEKLLENGVTVEQIEKSTTPKEVGNAYVTVTEINKGDID